LDAASAAWVQPGVSGAWHVVVRFGGSKATMAAARELAAQAAAANGARSTEVVDDAGALWRSIAELPATLREQLPAALLVRLSVPPKELPAALGLVADLAAAHKLEPPQMAAHACITSLYAAFSGDTAALGALGELLRTRAHALHGHLVVEHAPPGVQLAPWDEPGASFKLMQAIKRKFDPNNILNPGRFVGGI
jgi:glycolate oxidase FAD binding subunit